MTLIKKKPKVIPKGYLGYDMKVKIIAEKVDDRVKLKTYTKSKSRERNQISGTEFDVIYEAYADFLELEIYFGRNGKMDNLQKPIELKFRTEWRIELDQCSGLDCPIIDPRNSGTDSIVKTQCFFDKLEIRENSKF